MITVAALCGFAGLILGLSSNVRMLILVVLLLAIAAFVAGGSYSLFVAVIWSVTAVVSAQIGYFTMVVVRAIWSVAQAKYRQPVPY